MNSNKLKFSLFSFLLVATLHPVSTRGQERDYIQLRNPVGGEVLQSGASCAITWETSDKLNTVSLKLWDGLQSRWTSIAKGIPGKLGSYSWEVPSGLKGNCFRIRVESEKTLEIFEMSKTFFSIEPFSKGVTTGGKSLVENVRVSIFPNPFTKSTTINFMLVKPGPVEIIITDAAYSKIIEHRKELMAPGYHNIEINTEKWQRGVYLCSFMYNGKGESILINHIK